MINLGKKSDLCSPCCHEKDEDKKYYPTLYISGVKGLDLDMGDVVFVAKGRVRSVAEREKSKGGEEMSYEIDVHEIEVKDESSIEDKMDRIAKKKSSS